MTPSKQSFRYIYNPRRASTEELQQTFVSREALLDRLLNHVKMQNHAKSLQHLLLVGPRGSGKTHLVTLLLREIVESKLKTLWRPIQLAEEEWKVRTLRDLMIAVFKAMEKADPDPEGSVPKHLTPKEAVRELNITTDVNEGGELGLSMLKELSIQTGRKNLLVIENLDMILDNQFNDLPGLHRLRNELMVGSDIMVIATSPAGVEGLEQHENPLFGLFHPIRLDDLSLDDLESLLRKRAQYEAKNDPEGSASAFIRRLDESPYRVRSLLFLTGGNPRTALMLYQVVVHAEFQKMQTALSELLDELTNYFQERLKDIAPQERQIVAVLAEHGRALRPSEIAAEIGVSGSQASALIGRLVDKGYLRQAPQREGRGRYYILRDVLLRYWMLWRSNENDFTLFAEFLAAWFQQEELRRLMEQYQKQGGLLSQILTKSMAAQHEVYDLLMMNQSAKENTTDSYMAGATPDSLSLDPVIRRILDDFGSCLPGESKGGCLTTALESGDWEAVDALADEICDLLIQEKIPMDQEIGCLAQVLISNFGEKIADAAEAVWRRRNTNSEVVYLKVCALEKTEKNQEAMDVLKGLMDRVQNNEDELLFASIQYFFAKLLFNNYEYKKALDFWTQSLEQYKQMNCRLGEANCLVALGDLFVRTSELDEAQRAYDQALPLYRAINSRLGEAKCLLALGDLFVRTSDLDKAQRAYDQALPLYRAIKSRPGEANCLISLGGLFVRTSDLDKAKTTYDHALSLYREIEQRLGEANCLFSLGGLFFRTSDLDEAKRAYDQALSLYREIKERVGEANCLKDLGRLFARTSDLDEAKRAYEQALSLYREIKEQLGEANCLFSLGDLLVRTSDLDEAKRSFDQALPLCREIKDRLGEANCLRALGHLAVFSEDLTQAKNYLDGALALFREIGDRLGELSCIGTYGSLYLKFNRPKEAVLEFEKSITISRELQDVYSQAMFLWLQSFGLRQLGLNESALAALYLSKPLAEKAQMNFRKSIDEVFVRFGKEIELKNDHQLMNRLEKGAEEERKKGIQHVKAIAQLETRMSDQPEKMDQLKRTLEAVHDDQVDEKKLAEKLGAMQQLLEDEAFGDIALAFLQGEFVRLLAENRIDDSLKRINLIKNSLSNDKNALLYPIEVAARCLRDSKEDMRILDQQPPEIRAAVESIISAVEKMKEDSMNRKKEESRE